MAISQKDVSMKIVFMGTPEFAVPSLARISEKYNVVAVITAPDKPAGRGKKMSSSAVKDFALENNLRLLQPANLKDPDFIEDLKVLDADLQVIVAFRMLPEVVWSMPPLGSVNLHGSLLPDYRGAAPINHAIINGEKKTGVSTFFLKHKIDTGDIILQKEIPISEDETAGELHDRMMDIGAEALMETLEQIEHRTVKPMDQESLLRKGEVKDAPKIFKENCKIKWNIDGSEIHNLIRGLSPFPGAYSILIDEKGGENLLKIFRSKITDIRSSDITAGTVKIDNGKMYIATADHFIELLEIQLAGKKRMKAEEFLRGFTNNHIVLLS